MIETSRLMRSFRGAPEGQAEHAAVGAGGLRARPRNVATEGQQAEGGTPFRWRAGRGRRRALRRRSAPRGSAGRCDRRSAGTDRSRAGRPSLRRGGGSARRADRGSFPRGRDASQRSTSSCQAGTKRSSKPPMRAKTSARTASAAAAACSTANAAPRPASAYRARRRPGLLGQTWSRRSSSRASAASVGSRRSWNVAWSSRPGGASRSRPGRRLTAARLHQARRDRDDARIRVERARDRRERLPFGARVGIERRGGRRPLAPRAAWLAAGPKPRFSRIDENGCVGPELRGSARAKGRRRCRRR